MPIQGTAADILKRAMIDLHDAFAPLRDRARMILTVHDELLIEARADAVDEVAAIVKAQMEGAADAQRAADGRRRDRRELEGREA